MSILWHNLLDGKIYSFWIDSTKIIKTSYICSISEVNQIVFFFVWWKCFIAMTDCLKIHKYYSVCSFIFINTFYNVRNLFPCQSKAICVNRKTQTRYDSNSSMANQNHKALMFLSNFVPVACFTFSFPWDSYSIDFRLKKMLEKISKHIYFRWIFRVTT